MKCPVCGSDNQSGAKFCKKCGAPMGNAAASTEKKPQGEAPSTDAHTGAEAGATHNEPASKAHAGNGAASGAKAQASEQPAAKPGTAAAPAPTAKPGTAAAPASATAPQPHAAGAAAGAAAASATAAAAIAKFGALPTKTKAIAGGVAAAVVIALVAIVLVVTGGPSDRQFEQDIRSSDIVKYNGGTYGTSGDLNVDSVKITNKKKQQIPAQWASFLGMSGDTWEYTADVKLSNDAVEETTTVSATYVKYQGKWQAFSSPSASGRGTYTAKKGPDEGAITAGIKNILSQAKTTGSSSQSTSYNSPTLSTLYDGADFSVTSNNVDGDTATVIIHAKKETALSAAEGDLTATFKFSESGSWNPESVTASDGMDSPNYDKVLGTWTGTFVRQSTNGSAKCYGGKDKGAKITFTSYDPKTRKLEGTFSGTAHYHAFPESDESSDAGDEYLENQQFSMTLKDNWYNYGGLSGTVGGAYSQSENEKGRVQIELILGDKNSDGTVEAIVRTQPNTKSWFTTEYSDMFSFTKDK